MITDNSYQYHNKIKFVSIDAYNNNTPHWLKIFCLLGNNFFFLNKYLVLFIKVYNKQILEIRLLNNFYLNFQAILKG